MFNFLKELLVPPTIEGKTFTDEEKDLIDKLVNQINKVSKKKFIIKKFIQDEKYSYGKYRLSEFVYGVQQRSIRNEVTEIIQYDLIFDKYRFDLRFDRIHSDNKESELDYGCYLPNYLEHKPEKPWVFIWVMSRDYSSIKSLSNDVKIFIGDDKKWIKNLKDEVSSILKEINKRMVSYLK